MLLLTVYTISANSISATITQDADTSAKATVSVNLIPMLDGIVYEGELFVFVHDLSTCPSTRILINNYSMPATVEFEIGLVAIDQDCQYSSDDPPTVYGSSTVFVHVTDLNGSIVGDTVLTFDAVALDSAIDVELGLVMSTYVDPTANSSEYQRSDEPPGGYTDDTYDVDYEWAWLKAGEVHSITNLTVQWRAYSSGADKTILYFQSYARTITWNNYCVPSCVSDTNWTSCGKTPTECVTDCAAQATGNSAYEVLVQTKYRCEEWYYGPDIGNPYIEQWYYLMTPLFFNDADEGQSIPCNDCNTEHPYYASVWESWEGSPFNIGFDPETQDNTIWKITDVDFSFGFSIRELFFGVGFSIGLYESAGGTSAMPPYLQVTVNSGTLLYNWHDDGDAEKFIVHFSWI